MIPSVDCVRESSSHMWIYVFPRNALRGIGETPVTPLGISYIDDFAKAENAAFYIGELIPLAAKWKRLCVCVCVSLFVNRKMSGCHVF